MVVPRSVRLPITSVALLYLSNRSMLGGCQLLLQRPEVEATPRPRIWQQSIVGVCKGKRCCSFAVQIARSSMICDVKLSKKAHARRGLNSHATFACILLVLWTSAMFKCSHFGQVFSTQSGCTSHQRTCAFKRPGH